MKYIMFFCGAAIIALLFMRAYTLFTGRLPYQDDQAFIVGMASGYAPFVSVNADGQYEGFDIDIAHAIAQKMGKELILKDLGSMAPLFIALKQGTIDAIIWGLSITPERQRTVTMIHYQGNPITTYPLVFWQKIPAQVQSIEDMKGMTVCVEPASAQEAVLDKYPFIQKLSTEKVDDALLNIQYGKADAALVDPAIAQKFKRRYPQIQILELPLAPEDQVEGVGIALNKNNAALISQVQNAVTLLRATGELKKYEQKWNIP